MSPSCCLLLLRFVKQQYSFVVLPKVVQVSLSLRDMSASWPLQATQLLLGCAGWTVVATLSTVLAVMSASPIWDIVHMRHHSRETSAENLQRRYVSSCISCFHMHHVACILITALHSPPECFRNHHWSSESVLVAQLYSQCGAPCAAMSLVFCVQICDGRVAALCCSDRCMFSADLCCEEAGTGHVPKRLPHHQSTSYAKASESPQC